MRFISNPSRAICSSALSSTSPESRLNPDVRVHSQRRGFGHIYKDMSTERAKQMCWKPTTVGSHVPVEIIAANLFKSWATGDRADSSRVSQCMIVQNSVFSGAEIHGILPRCCVFQPYLMVSKRINMPLRELQKSPLLLPKYCCLHTNIRNALVSFSPSNLGAILPSWNTSPGGA